MSPNVKTDYQIRPGKPEDAEACFRLISALALFEKAPEQVSNSLEQLREDGFGKDPVYRLLVAEHLPSTKVVGIALYFNGYSTWKGRQLYLDDLMIDESHRRKGIATALMDALLEEAAQTGVQQFKLQVLDWNENAMALYRRYHMEMDDEWINCKMDRPAIDEWFEKHGNAGS